MSFSVFIVMGMGGKNSATITGLTLDTKVSELKQKIADKEGVEDIQMNFRGKPLRDELTLRDYNMHPDSNIFVSARLIGGAQAAEGQTDKTRTFNETKVGKFGVTRSLTDKCSCCWDNWAEDRKYVANMPCSHKACADCVFKGLTDAVKRNAKTKVECIYTGCGAVDIDLAMLVAGLSDAETKEFEMQLGKNAFGNSLCPNCQAFVFGGDAIADNRVRCSKCKGDWFCKVCSRKWTAEGTQVCGNVDCGSAAAVFEVLLNCPRKTIWSFENVPEIRLCPGCKKLNAHKSDCKHIKGCPNCSLHYCHVCLKHWGTDAGQCNNGITCKVADVQTSMNTN